MGSDRHVGPASLLRSLTGNRRAVLAVAGGTAGGQAVALVFSPVLSRIYTPADFGLFTVISAIIMTHGTVASLRFELAIPLPKEERDAHTLVLLGLLAALGTGLVGVGLIVFLGNRAAGWFKQPLLMPYLWLAPLTATVLGAFILLNQLAIRQRRFSAIGRRNLTQACVASTSQLILGLARLRPGGLILGLSLGQTVGTLSMLRGSGLMVGGRPIYSVGRLRAVARRYKHFPLILAPSGLLNVAGVYVPVLLIAQHYGPQSAGWLGLTQRTLALPVMLIGTAIGQVYLGTLAQLVRDGQPGAGQLFRTVSWRLGMFGAICAIPLLLAGPAMFAAVFGHQWRESGQYARAMSLSLAAQLLAAPLSQTLIMFERQLAQLSWDAGRLVLVMAGIAIAIVADRSAIEALWILSATSTAAYVGSWLLSRHTIATRLRRNTRPSST